MATMRTLTFADLLRRHRLATGLTHEDLAARAGRHYGESPRDLLCTLTPEWWRLNGGA
jgi:hypothetical protein